MQNKIIKSMFAAFILVFFASGASEAAEKKAASPNVDIETICYSAAEVCLDACDKAAYTGTEFNRCKDGCGNSMRACLGQTASQSNTATSKDEARSKRKKKKYVPPN